MFFKKKRKPEEIIQMLREGKTQVIEEFYASGFRTIKKHILNNNGTEDDAKDVYQESIIILLEKVHSPDFSLTTEIEGYLFGVSKNIWQSRLRKQTIQQEKLERGKSYFSVLTDEEIIWIETATTLLSEYLQKVGSPCFEILNQYYFQKLSLKQIALNLNYSSEDTAKTTKNRCMNKLKTMMGELNF